MTTETFFANFAHLADAPNGVQKLRELILSLAVRGKLVPQDSNDEPASVLLTRIKAEKERLVKEKKIKKAEPLPPVTADEAPYEVPKGWEWVRLGNVIEYDAADKCEPKDIPDDAWLLELEDVEKETSRILQMRTFQEKQSKSNKARFVSGDVLYGKLRPYLNKVVVALEEGYCTTEIIALRSYMGITPDYLKYTLKGPDFLQYVNSKTYGVKMPRLGTDDGKNSLFPLPPLAEQHRIVTKVDQLMALCDELEERQRRHRAKLIRLNNAALDRLLTAREADALTASWRLVRDNFDLLYTTPETITKLRQAILQLAVQGKFFTQDPHDEPASVLLARIKAEKERLVKEKKIKKAEPLPPVTADEAPYEVPERWEWVRLGNVSTKIADGEHSTPRRTLSGYYLLSARNITNKGIAIDNVDYVGVDEFNRIRKRCDPSKGDILISCSGSIGRIAIVDEDNKYVMVRSAAMVRFSGHILPGYSSLVLQSPCLQSQMTEKSRSTAQANLFLGKISTLVYPLPPLAEQHRIVAKVDQLMALCDDLEARLTISQAKAGNMASAAIRALLAA